MVKSKRDLHLHAPLVNTELHYFHNSAEDLDLAIDDVTVLLVQPCGFVQQCSIQHCLQFLVHECISL